MIIRKFSAVFVFLLASAGVYADQIDLQLQFSGRSAVAGVLYVPMPRKTAGAAGEVELDQRQKKFTSRLVVSEPGGKVVFLNSDKYDHNIYASDKEMGVHFDFGLMPKGTRLVRDVDWPVNSLLRVGCKIHPRMRAYIANIESEHAVSIPFERRKTDYQVALELPEGSGGKVSLMIAGLDPIMVQLKKNAATRTMDLIKSGKKVGTATFTRVAGK